MAYFLRFTDTAKQDLERGTSIHASDLSIDDFSKEQVAEIFECDVDNVGIFDESYCQILDGICGYSLSAETLEEAIEEIEENDYQFKFVGKAVIFKGRYSNDSDLIPDGDLFVPHSIEKEF
jgi:hypothetical protein